MSDNNPQPQGLPQPDPALKRLDRLAGIWSMNYLEDSNVNHPSAPDPRRMNPLLCWANIEQSDTHASPQF